MNNIIKNNPRTILAGTLSVALMFAAGGVMAQDADHDRHDRTATENTDSDQPMSDTWITTKVKSSLLADSEVAGLDVEVETVNGVVHLRGDVDSQAQIDRAVEIARDIDGVTNVDASSLNTAVGTSDF
ncbi:BON domain-containing protein [Luteimonas sp. MJ293]|uniref:BON domain-containing protein n=1 Tax=Luteimonas sp. MJ146 TaxID=3129240 RepID=UPI0031BB3A20